MDAEKLTQVKLIILYMLARVLELKCPIVAPHYLEINNYKSCSLGQLLS